jgi:hypothetical protein
MPSVPLMSEAFLLLELDRRETSARERLSSALVTAISHTHDALAHERERTVRERREVTRAPERAILEDDRCDARIQHAEVRLGGDATNAGAPGCERCEAQEHHRADDLGLHLGTAAGSMRAHERALQLVTHLGRDIGGGERAEAGAHAVDGLTRCREFVNPRTCRLDGGDRLGGELHGRASARDSNHAFDTQGSGSDNDWVHAAAPFICERLSCRYQLGV